VTRAAGTVVAGLATVGGASLDFCAEGDCPSTSPVAAIEPGPLRRGSRLSSADRPLPAGKQPVGAGWRLAETGQLRPVSGSTRPPCRSDGCGAWFAAITAAQTSSRVRPKAMLVLSASIALYVWPTW